MAARWAPVAVGRVPFPVRIEGFGRFDNEHSILFARVAPDDVLAQFADDALAACADLRQKRSRPFVPHVTLAVPSLRAAVDDYLQRLAADALDLSFTCDRFSMLRLDEEARRWEVLRDFPFES
jgi:2'-5' RNA ligase